MGWGHTGQWDELRLQVWVLTIPRSPSCTQVGGFNLSRKTFAATLKEEETKEGKSIVIVARCANNVRIDNGYSH